ncbi:MAG: glycosyltransferase family 4 protein [Deltaproteobacteria bacterium]|nr:glycosyltransferase family 4 protein [Deltaproteobacteria bacterium]
MNRATVIHVITELELGGAQEITLFTCRHLDRRRFEVHLITGRGGLLDADARAIPDLFLQFDDHLGRAVNFASDLRCLRSLTGRLRAIRRRSARPTIVHTHSSKAGILGRWAAFAAGADIRVHAIHGFGFHAGQPWWLRRAYQAAEQVTAPITDAFCPVSTANLEVARRLGLLRGGKPTLVLPSAIDAAEYEPKPGEGAALRRELAIPESAPLVGMIACLKPQKAPTRFVEAASRVAALHPQAHFFLAGDGELRPQVEAAVDAARLADRFHLLGWRRDVRRLLAAADVLALTSLWEGLPRVTLQAMAAAKPMVATRVDGTPEAVIDGRTGFLVESSDVAAFADRLSRLIADPALARDLGRNAHARLDDFRAESMLRKLEAFYDELLERR